MKRKNLFLITLVLFFVIMLIVPLIMPIPPLDGIQPAEELYYADSQIVGVDGIDVHYIESGEGEQAFILLHGFGSSTYSWRKVFSAFSTKGKVIAYDRPGFGLTERITNPDSFEINPYTLEYQAELLIKLMDLKNIKHAILVGNSAGASVAIYTAAFYPERVKALILVDPAVSASGGIPGWGKFIFSFPQFDRLGPFFVRSIEENGLELLKMAWADEEKITDEDLLNYQRPLKMENWDIGLWEYTKVNGDVDVAQFLSQLTMPVIVISGMEDQLIPVEESIAASEKINNAQFFGIDHCGHVLQEECPEEFMKIVNQFLKGGLTGYE